MNGLDLSSARWRKSSHSGETGGECVEVAALELASATWRKSSRSTDTGGQCVEVAALSPAVAVRDSKDPHGPKLVVAAEDWHAFIAGIKHQA